MAKISGSMSRPSRDVKSTAFGDGLFLTEGREEPLDFLHQRPCFAKATHGTAKTESAWKFGVS
jgi:hypothetical protein